MIQVPKFFADSLAAAGSQTVSKKNMQAAAGSAESYIATLKNVIPKMGIDSSMLKKLRGRNLGHPGCLIGITTGLTLGIVLAGILASVYNVALNTDLLVWFGLTIGLGTIGWIVGDRLSARFPAVEEDLAADDKEIS